MSPLLLLNYIGVAWILIGVALVELGELGVKSELLRLKGLLRLGSVWFGCVFWRGSFAGWGWLAAQFLCEVTIQ